MGILGRRACRGRSKKKAAQMMPRCRTEAAQSQNFRVLTLDFVRNAWHDTTVRKVREYGSTEVRGRLIYRLEVQILCKKSANKNANIKRSV